MRTWTGAAVAVLVLLVLAVLVRLWRRWAAWVYGRQLARRVAQRDALEACWRLRVSVDGSPRLDLSLEQLRAWAAFEGRPPGAELGIPGAELVHVSLRWVGGPLQPVRGPLGSQAPDPASGPREAGSAPCPPDG